jgi:hypothetical protein
MVDFRGERVLIALFNKEHVQHPAPEFTGKRQMITRFITCN